MSNVLSREIDACPAIGVQQLLNVPHPELVELWKTLPAPSLGELQGEYAGYLPIAGLSADAVGELVRSMYQEQSPTGYWIGKTFTALDDTSGEGHNLFRTSKEGVDGFGYVRNGRFTTHVGTSLVDGGPALMMTYGSFNNRPGRSGLVDEVRRFSKGLYLGTATQPRGDGTRTEASGCFLLTGPFNPWIGPDDPHREVL
jgi:hypothetical protein